MNTRVHRRALGILILLLGFGLRVQHLGVEELRGDEAFGYFLIQASPLEIIRQTVRLAEPHPVLGYLLLKGWWRVAGNTEFALRFPGVWFGVLAIALLYLLMLRLSREWRGAVLAALFLAINPHAIWHSQDARMYSEALTWTILSSWLAWHLFTQGQSWALVGYVLTMFAGLHTHYYLGFILIAQNVAFVTWSGLPYVRRRERHWRAWILAQVLLVASYAPWLFLVRHVILGSRGLVPSLNLGSAIGQTLSVLVGTEAFPALRVPTAIFVGLAYVFGVGRLIGWRRWAEAWYVLLLFALPLGLMWWAEKTRPPFQEQLTIILLPSFLLGLAATSVPRFGKQRLRDAVRIGIFAGLLAVQFLGLQSLYTSPVYTKTLGWRTLARRLHVLTLGFQAHEVRIVQNFPDPTLWYYFREDVGHLVLPPKALDKEGAQTEVHRLMKEHVRWILFPRQQAPAWDNGGIALHALCQGYARVHEETIGPWTLFVLGHPGHEYLLPQQYTFTNGLVLKMAAVQPRALVPGGILAIHLLWQAPPTLDIEGLQFFIHLTSLQDATPLAQVDKPIVLGIRPCGGSSYGLTVPPELRDSEYRVFLGVYDTHQAGAPRIPLVGGGSRAELVRLKRLQTLPRQVVRADTEMPHLPYTFVDW